MEERKVIVEQPSQTRLRWSYGQICAAVLVLLFGAGLSTAVFNRIKERRSQWMVLAHAKGSYAVLVLYANDHDGAFPAHRGGAPSELVRTANEAFREIVPSYDDGRSFFIPGSAWCWKSGSMKPVSREGAEVPLPPGANGYSYVRGLKNNDATLSDMPLIANAFAGQSGPVFDPHYVRDPKQHGGLWNGKVSVVVSCGGAGSFLPVDPDGRVYTNRGGERRNVFQSSGNSDSIWLHGCVVLNPE